MFTSVFSLEMLLKLLACGPLGYVRSPYNIFDGVIVVIRCVPGSCPACRPGQPQGRAATPRGQSPGRVESTAGCGADRLWRWDVGQSPLPGAVLPCRHCQATCVSHAVSRT